MKLDVKNVTLDADNLRSVQEHIKAGSANTTYQGLLCVIADVLDTAISDGDTWLSIGLTKPKDALIITVRQGNASAYAGGLRLTELSKDAEKLLPPL